MLKRTTVYLEDSEVETLRRLSFLKNVSMAELIRRGVQDLCRTYSKDQKEALSILADIKKETAKNKISPSLAMKAALKIQKEVRSERKTSRR